MKFNYTAINKNGIRVSGTAHAKDKFELAHQLKTEGSLLVSVKEETENSIMNLTFINALVSRVKMQEKVIFAKNLSAMIKAGLSLSRSISIMKRQTKNEKFKRTLETVENEISKGNALNVALSKFPKIFSPLFIAMVKAGEESGGLADSLSVIGTQMEKTYKLRKKIRGALMYPSIIVIAMIIVGALMLIYVVPTLTSTFKELNVDLPASTQAIILVSDFLVAHTILALMSLIVVVAGIAAFMRTQRGKRYWDFTILHLPIISPLVKKTNSARTARTLSSLLSSGVDMLDGIRITEEVLQNSYYKEVMREAEKKVQKGTALSSSFIENEELYPILVGEMIEVGEETGKLSDMLLQVAVFYENEIEETTKNMSTIIEPVLMVVVGVVVGFFAVSMISPTYSLLNSI